MHFEKFNERLYLHFQLIIKSSSAYSTVFLLARSLLYHESLFAVDSLCLYYFFYLNLLTLSFFPTF